MSLIGGLLGLGGSLLSSMFGSASSKSANATNMRIAQMNNEFNERMLDKQMAYNTEMWEKQNEYNSAVSQVRRYKEAGLNPYLMVGNGNAGVASSALGVSPPSASPVQVQPEGFVPNVGEMVSSVSQILGMDKILSENEKSRQEARALSIDNEYKASLLKASLEGMNISNRMKSFEEKVQPMSFDADYSSRMASSLASTAMAELYREQKVGQALSNSMSSMRVAKYPQILTNELRQQVAQIALMHSQKKLNLASARNQIANAIEAAARTQGINISNYIAGKTADSVIRQNYKTEDILEQTRRGAQRFESNWFTDGLQSTLNFMSPVLPLVTKYAFKRP